MNTLKIVKGKDGYFVDERGDRIIFYGCDPSLNVFCPKTNCAVQNSIAGEAKVDGCTHTMEPTFSPDKIGYYCKMVGDKAEYERVV